MGHYKSGISIAYWNINGLMHKMDDDDFVNSVNRFNICFISETWSNTTVLIENKIVLAKYAQKIKGRKGRFSGGISAIIDESLRKGVTRVDIKCDYGIWLRLNKQIFGFEDDIFLCGIYIPPKDSPYWPKDVYNCLEKDVMSLSQRGQITLMGDMNARTSDINEIIVPDKHVDYLAYPEPSKVIPPKRIVRDNELDSEGKKLIQFCKHSDLVILNGRTFGDIPGAITCFQRNGHSTPDYGIVSNRLLRQVVYFKVEPATYHSDHCLIKMKLINRGRKIHVTPSNLHPLPQGFKWNAIGSLKFKQALDTMKCQDLSRHILENDYYLDQTGVDQIGKDLTNLIINAADMSLKRKLNVNNKKKRKHVFNKDIDDIYKRLKQDIKNIGYLLSKYPRDPFIRGRYFYLKKNIKQIIAKAKKEQKNQIINKIQEAEEKNPDQFWKLVNEIRKKEGASTAHRS